MMGAVKDFLKPTLWKLGFTVFATISTSLIISLELYNNVVIEALIFPVWIVKAFGFFIVCGGDLGLGIGGDFRATELFTGCSKTIEIIASIVLYYLIASLISYIFRKIKAQD